MKATGIVRRIDDLGRVVIPKEIRRTLRIKEGAPLEIFTDRSGEIILKKYSPIGELSSFAKEYADALAHTCGHTVCITDRDQIIAVSGKQAREYAGKNISPQLERLINDRERLVYPGNTKEALPITGEDTKDYTGQTAFPILCEGDAIGAVLICSCEPSSLGVSEENLTKCAAEFMGRQMEQ